MGGAGAALRAPQALFIHEGRLGGGGVYVHCAMGVSRSSTAVLAYLLAAHEGLSLDDALRFLRARRPNVNPNAGFVAQRRRLEADAIARASLRRVMLLRAGSAALLREDHAGISAALGGAPAAAKL